MTTNRMKPVVILPPQAMRRSDIKKLNDNGFVVVEAADPGAVRFCEPPPGDYSVQERAAIALCRYLLNNRGYTLNRSDISIMFTDLLLKGSPLKEIEPVKG